MSIFEDSMDRKGIIMAGGSGNRLFPLTKIISKHLLNVFDKPMIYYPLSTLMLAGIKEILIISNNDNIRLFKNLLGNGNQLGLSIHYAIENCPDGIANGLIIGENFLADNPCTLILGDNLFYGNNLREILLSAYLRKETTIFSYHVNDPERYGNPDFDTNGEIKKIIEKPSNPKNNLAITGMYFFDTKAIQLARKLKASNRGELEITDLINLYIKKYKLHIEKLRRGLVWFDMGTYNSLLEANNFAHFVQSRQGLRISCPEEIALRLNLINPSQLLDLIKNMPKNEYSKYLLSLTKN